MTPTSRGSGSRSWSAPASPTSTCTASDRCGPSRRPAPPSGMRTRIADPSGPPSTARKPAAPSSRSSTGTSARRTSPASADAAGDPRPTRSRRRGAGRAGMAAGTDQLASAAPRRRAAALTDQAGGAGRVTFDLRRNAAAFEYRFEEDTELSGPMTLRLQVRTNGCDRSASSSSASRSGPAARPVPFQRLVRLRSRPRRPGPAPPRAARTRLRAQHPPPARTHLPHPAARPRQRGDRGRDPAQLIRDPLPRR